LQDEVAKYVKREASDDLRDNLRDNVITIFMVAQLTTLKVYGVLTSRTYQLQDGVMAIWLVKGCELWYFAPPAK
jgi:hypothetical protein